MEPSVTIKSDIFKGRLPGLDGVRGLAILLVMAYHFVARIAHTRPMSDEALSIVDHLAVKITDAGWVGVEIFFVLSGFLITGILYQSRLERGYFRVFYARRTLRIAPLYYSFLILGFLATPYLMGSKTSAFAIPSNKHWWFWCYLTNWLFAYEGTFNLTNGGYLWSLAVEEQFYLIWPFIVLAFSARTLMYFCITLFFLTGLLRVYLITVGVSTTAVYTMSISHADGLILGSCLVMAVQEFGAVRLRPLMLSLFASSFLGAIAVIYFNNWNFRFYDENVAAFGYSCVAVLSACLIWAVLPDSGMDCIRCRFEGAFLRSFGKFSYAIYLIHIPIAVFIMKGVFDPGIHKIANEYLPSIILYCLSCIAICWMVALGSWHLFEKQILKLKSYFPYHE